MKYTRIAVLDPFHRHRETMRQWCRDTIGPAQNNTTRLVWFSRAKIERFPTASGARIIKHYTVFYFHDNMSATLFALRWI